ncbi:hypothetical protein BsWGS_00728 [Bradybaena similaris]
MNNDIKKEFLQKYKLDNYSRAVPATNLAGRTALLAEYCEPIDSRSAPCGASDDHDGYSSDPEKRYAQPQDAIDVQNVKQTKLKANQSDDDDLYQLAQQPAEEYGVSQHRKPSPKPRSGRHAQLQQQNSAPLQIDSKSTGQIKKDRIMSPDLSAEAQAKKKRPGKKVVEIEYEVASEIRLNKASDSPSLKSNHDQGHTKSIANSNKHIQPSLHTPITSASAPPQQSQYAHPAGISQGFTPSIDTEVAYEEPWDLKMKRLKQEQENKAKRLAKRTDKLPGIPKTGTYESPWDNATQQQKSEVKAYARSVSQTSELEVFHDALDSFSDLKSETSSIENADPDKNISGKLKPLPQNTYEDAWDLKNSLLEMKIREMQLQASAIYEEPWDSSKQQKQLKAKLSASSSVPIGNSEIEKLVKTRSDAQDPSREDSESVAPSTRGKHQVRSETSAKSRGHGCNIGQRINPMIPLACQNWYHGNISREDAEKMLCVCKEGSYIVRISTDRRSYSLSIKSVRQNIHVQIDQKTNEDGTVCYILGKNSKEFNTIPEMIDYYTHHRVPLRGAEHITLLHPVECKWS